MPYLPINVPGDAVATLVPGLAGYRIKIPRMNFVASAATVVQLASGGTVLTGPMSLTANGTFTMDKPFYITEPGESFNIAQTGGATFGGVLNFEYIPASRPIRVVE